MSVNTKKKGAELAYSTHEADQSPILTIRQAHTLYECEHLTELTSIYEFWSFHASQLRLNALSILYVLHR